MGAGRRVTDAVNAVLDLAPRKGEVTLTALVEAVGRDRDRSIEIISADLPPGCAVNGASTRTKTSSSFSAAYPPGIAHLPTNSATWCCATKVSRWSKWQGMKRNSPVMT